MEAEREMEVSTDVIKINNGEIGVVTLAGDAYNSLTAENLTEVCRGLGGFDEDPRISGMILNSSRENYFSNGLSPSYMIEKSTDEKVATFRKIYELLKDMLGMKKPIVAEINGHANAAGAILALACDHRIMANTGRFCFSEVKAGLFLTACLTRLVMRSISPHALREAVIFGRAFKPEEARSVGLINELVDSAADLRKKTVFFFKGALRIPSGSMAQAKRVCNGEIIDYLDKNTEADMRHLREFISTGSFDENMRSLAARL